jgi:hypothetical protein
MGHGGERVIHEVLKQLVGEARVDQFFAWCFIVGGILLPVLLPIRISRGKRPDRWLWPGVPISLVLGGALVALGGVVLSDKEKLAVAAIRDAGGDLIKDENAPGKPVVRVDFEWGFRRGYNLATLRPHLERLPQLRYLRITSWAKLSDADLVDLEGLKQLNTIELGANPVSLAGVKRLRQKLTNTRIVVAFEPGSPVLPARP